MVPQHSPAWVFFCYASFALAITLMGVGIYYLPIEDHWVRGYLGMASVLLMASTINMTKTLRDNFEAEKEAEDAAQTPRPKRPGFLEKDAA